MSEKIWEENGPLDWDFIAAYLANEHSDGYEAAKALKEDEK